MALRHEAVQERCVNMTRHLHGTGLMPRQPIPICLQRGRTRITAAAPKLGLILEVNGDTITTALKNMAGGISEQYWVLRHIPRALRSEFQLKLLRRMRRFIKESSVGGPIAA
jgi:hypothetical protein